MNRKLLNGMLVLTLAAGGIGTFTSCKDENFNNEAVTPLYDLAAQVQAIRDMSDPEFSAKLNDWLDKKLAEWEANHPDKDCPCTPGNPDCPCNPDNPDNPDNPNNPCGCDLTDINNKLDKLYGIYQAIIANPQDFTNPDAAQLVNGLYNWMKENIFPNEQWFQDVQYIQGDHTWIYNILKRASSIEVSQTYNPVFGTINLPIGLKTTVLASYLFEGTGTYTDYNFPAGAKDRLASVVNTQANKAALDVIAQLAPEQFALENGQFSDFGENGNMGNVYTVINPTSVNFVGSKNIQLVNSKGDVILDGQAGDLVVEECTDDLSFGATRGVDLGLYSVKANATLANYKPMKFDLENKGELKAAVKNLIKGKSASDIAGLGQAIYSNIQDIMPAFALRVWWNEDVPQTNADGSYQKDANGNVVTVSQENSIVSNFDIAAAVLHPLSYSLDLGSVVPSKHLPTLNSLKYYLDKIGNKLDIQINDIEGLGNVSIALNVEIRDNQVWFTYTDSETGEEITAMVADYTLTGIDATNEDLNSFVNAILYALNLELEGDLNWKVVKELNDAIDNINNQLKDFAAQVENITDIFDRIKNSSKLNYAQKLVDFYNEVVTKINHFLDNPNAYLQVMMAYKAKNGGLHHVSTDAIMPTQAAGTGYVTLYSTSYTGDVVVPSYKKYVAITSAKKNGQAVSVNDLKDLNSKAGEQFNKVISGVTQEVFINASALSGYSVGISYLSVDYHGVCSMQTYYMQF